MRFGINKNRDCQYCQSKTLECGRWSMLMAGCLSTRAISDPTSRRSVDEVCNNVLSLDCFEKRRSVGHSNWLCMNLDNLKAPIPYCLLRTNCLRCLYSSKLLFSVLECPRPQAMSATDLTNLLTFVKDFGRTMIAFDAVGRWWCGRIVMMMIVCIVCFCSL